jgi:hypothetical protein
VTTVEDNRTNEKSGSRAPTFVEFYPNNAQGAAVLFSTAVCATIALESIIYIGWGVIWTDFIHDNPNRPITNALIMPFVLGPLGAVWLIVDMLSALLVASYVVYAAVSRSKHFAFPTLVYLIPICVLLVFIQDNATPNMTWYTDTPETDAMKYGPLGRLAEFSAFLVPALFISWWIVRRSLKRAGEKPR